MRSAIITLAVITLTLAAGDSSAQTTTAATPAVPDAVGTLKVTETHRYPDPRLGTLYRYRDDSQLAPDVYVYPIADGPGEPLNPAREEGMSFGQVLTAQRNQRRIAAFRILESEARQHVAGTDTIQGWHVHAEVDARGKHDTHLYLYAVGSTMVKVRATFDHGSVQPAEVEAFVQGLLRAMLEPER